MMKKLLVVLMLAITMVACTPNQRAKKFGGTMTIELPKGKKLVDVTWKASNLWYLTRDFKEGEEPTTLEFNEDSNFGQLQGKIIFKEKK